MKNVFQFSLFFMLLGGAFSKQRGSFSDLFQDKPTPKSAQACQQ